MVNTNLSDLLRYIDPSVLSYQEWVNVGMALHYEGYDVNDWEDWSASDTLRYHSGECERKWDTFKGTTKPVTGATLVQLAKEGGWVSPSVESRALDWNDTIEYEREQVFIDKNWLELEEVRTPNENWDGTRDLIKYLETLFDSNDYVGYVVKSFEKEDGKRVPQKGNWDRTAGELIQALSNTADIGAILGDYDPSVGAWIRFNPLDGKGCRNDNVTEFKYALVESDTADIPVQMAIIKELELPVAALVHSGNKSIHAIVKIDASDYNEYRKRVDYLYSICKKNGLDIDTQNRNPSRLSRLPGVIRNDNKQFLISTNTGKENWKEWHEFIESINDDLPDPESLTGVWENMPELAPALIEGVLRQGHKMLVAGPSKAGKSFSLIELCIAIAEGDRWLGWDCAQGPVLYVNLELDRASCFHRFKDVYEALKLPPKSLENIDIWNLRGKSMPMDKLAPKLIRRAAKKKYMAIVIDPIYKVITGDENSADQMAYFCNQFDLIASKLNAAVIYCHHHSKGSQGGKKAVDRSSGSGVFARDPDVILDLSELELTDGIIKAEENKMMCAFIKQVVKTDNLAYYEENVSLDDELSKAQMLIHAKDSLVPSRFNLLEQSLPLAAKKAHSISGWRIECTLREFPKFEPINLFFRYPLHVLDESGVLKDVEVEGNQPAYQKASKKRQSKAKKDRENKKKLFEDAVQNCNFGNPPTVKDIQSYLSDAGTELADRTIRDWIKKYGYQIDKENGNTVIKSNGGGDHDL